MAMYKDAKHWFEEMASDGAISTEQMISCILSNLDNDDIERWFGVSMESEDDNPGQAVECPVCGTETNDADTIADHGMCLDCLHERDEEEEADEDDSEVFYNFEIGTRRIVWLDARDFDYVLDPADDTNVYPFPSSETL
jgi:hypothetical protein